MQNKVKKRIIDTLLIIIVIILCGSGFVFLKESKEAHEIKKEDEQIIELVKENINVEKGFDKQTFNALKKVNPDLIGFIEFDSGIIAQPIVKAEDNDKYLRRSFNGNKSSQGSIFMDYQYSFNDQNPVIYGHNVFYDSNAKFSPLAKILKQDFYEQNSRFSIYTENEKRNYVITDAYVFNTTKMDSFSYIKPNFEGQEDFDNWYASVKKLDNINSIYGNVNSDSKMITLQTCKSLNSPERIVILAKLETIKNY